MSFISVTALSVEVPPIDQGRRQVVVQNERVPCTLLLPINDIHRVIYGSDKPVMVLTKQGEIITVSESYEAIQNRLLALDQATLQAGQAELRAEEARQAEADPELAMSKGVWVSIHRATELLDADSEIKLTQALGELRHLLRKARVFDPAKGS